MNIYLAGQAPGIEQCPHKLKYRHVLFSFFIFKKKDFRWMAKRKLAELKKRKKAK